VGDRRCYPPAPHHSERPSGCDSFDRRFNQAIASETAPRLKLNADTRLGAGQGHKIARAAAAQRVDQLRQEAGGEGLRPCVQLDSRLHRHRFIVQRAAKRAIEVVGS
jgi:hypothetical protein